MAAITGLYQNTEESTQAARVLRDAGFDQFTVRPLSEVNLALLPTSSKEIERSMIRAILAVPLGFFLLAPLGFAVGLIAGMWPGAFAGFFFGGIGAAVVLVLVDRAPAQYRRLAEKGGVLLTAPCTQETRERVIELLRGTRPAELLAPLATTPVR